MTDTSHAIIHGAEARTGTEPTLCLEPKSAVRPTWKSEQDAVLKKKKKEKKRRTLSTLTIRIYTGTRSEGEGVAVPCLCSFWKQGRDFQHSSPEDYDLACSVRMLFWVHPTHWEFLLIVIVLNPHFHFMFTEYKQHCHEIN